MYCYIIMKLQTVSTTENYTTVVYLTDETTNWEHLPLNSSESYYIQQQIEKKVFTNTLNRYTNTLIIVYLDKSKSPNESRFLENCRMSGAEVTNFCNRNKFSSIAVANESDKPNAANAFVEGMYLANYQFIHHRKDAATIKNALSEIAVLEDAMTKAELTELQHILEGVCHARNLINEPLNYMTATDLANAMEKMCKESKCKVTVLHKSQIEKEKMGGLLAVNRGSIDPPTFTIMEWKPKNAVNKQPIVLIGKGVVFDTGGLSLKPTSNSMDYMKCDMAGAAGVAGAMYAISKNKLPVHVIGLVPATDNRPGVRAYVPGDIIAMRSGMTVEMLNADAEGRMILADALDFAKQYKPELVIDIATLTGALLYIIGVHGIGLMSNTNHSDKQTLVDASYRVYERCHELPMWEEYRDMMKSDIADIRNVPNVAGQAGTITAGKFLEAFTDYPWIHLDIAGIAWNHSNNGYRIKGGEGSGVRLFYEFLKNRCQLKD